MEGVEMSDHKKVEVVMVASRRPVVTMRRILGSYDLVLRVMALALTLAAAVVAGLDEETHIIPIKIFTSMPPLRISATAKWNYLSSSVFFVVSNAIACAYSAASFLLSLWSGAGSGKIGTTTMVLLISDLIVVALLFSADGAFSAIGFIGLHGNSHVQWHKVCFAFKRFCRNGAASITLSVLGSFAFLLLVIFATINLHKKSKVMK